MKTILFSLLIFLSSCQSSHFEFIDVDYFQLNISEDKHTELATKENKSEEEIVLNALLSEDYPNNLDDNFFKHLKKWYTFKGKINENKLSQLSEVYSNGFNFMKSKCIPIYRDILVFKKNDSIVGISKICFDCDMEYTIDKNGVRKKINNNNFSKLKQILK
jgi:hypothetical protein